MSENSVSGDDFVDVGGGDVNLSRMPAFAPVEVQAHSDGELDTSAQASQEGEQVPGEAAQYAAVDAPEGTV